MLLGVNGAEHEDNSEELELWNNEDESKDIMQEHNITESGPLCPNVPISVEERKNLCWP